MCVRCGFQCRFAIPVRFEPTPTFWCLKLLAVLALALQASSPTPLLTSCGTTLYIYIQYALCACADAWKQLHANINKFLHNWIRMQQNEILILVTGMALKNDNHVNMYHV